MWNRFVVGFVNGIALLLPVVVTVFLIRFLVSQLNSMILNPLMKFFEPVPMTSAIRTYAAKTLIFFMVIFTVAMIGWGAKILVINRVFSFGEGLIIRVPFLGRIYHAAKQIFASFIGHGKTIFKQVVIVEYPRKGLYSMGFTTGTAKGEIKDLIETAGESVGVNVFIPTTPNPTSGVFLIVPKASVKFLKMSVEDGMKLVISGGSVMN
jgi:uncharacterized membrane protein